MEEFTSPITHPFVVEVRNSVRKDSVRKDPLPLPLPLPPPPILLIIARATTQKHLKSSSPVSPSVPLPTATSGGTGRGSRGPPGLLGHAGVELRGEAAGGLLQCLHLVQLAGTGGNTPPPPGGGGGAMGAGRWLWVRAVARWGSGTGPNCKLGMGREGEGDLGHYLGIMAQWPTLS